MCCNRTLHKLCYLQHVHHLLELCGFDAGGLLHGEALEVLNDAEAVDLSLLVLQQLLQDNTISTQDLVERTHTIVKTAVGDMTEDSSAFELISLKH